jgi:uncharacterized RDD family membrane protein YckC
MSNPYAPTKAALNELTVEGPSEVLEPAPRWRRVANQLLDIVGITFAAMLLGFALRLVSMAVSVDVMQSTGPFFGLGVVFLYYFVCEAVFGQTLGKLVTGTRVVTESGARAPLWLVLFRSIYRFVPLEPLSIFSRRRLMWHDLWSKTRVVRVRRA